MNKLGYYAFPRNIKAPIHHFYLTDHVLIWRAIKAAEAMGLKHCLLVDRTADQDVREMQSRKSPGKRYYWSSVVQGHILKRFTAENPVSKKRMLSVSRSPSHIRFLLRNKDASLFHAMDSGLFDKPGASAAAAPDEDAWSNKLDIWKNLVDCQQLHEDNDDTTWDEPLRFALSMIMAKRGKAMNTRSAKEMHARATSVLFNSVWPNGLFPGQLDVDDEPTIFTDEWKRDTYWGSTFEIPYILWTHARFEGDQIPDVENTTATRKELPSSSMPAPELDFWISLKTLMENQLVQNFTNNVTAGPMKLSFPWNNLVDQTNIVQLSDEWLYNEPDFFKNEGHEIDMEATKQAFDIFTNSYSGDSNSCYEDFNPYSGQSLKNDHVIGVVINVPRCKAGKKTPPRLDDLCVFSEQGPHLYELIQERRQPHSSKKRFYASFASLPEAQRPYPQIPGELEAMMGFYSKHRSYEKYFFEYTSAENNRWTTEFHFSFYALARTKYFFLSWLEIVPKDLAWDAYLESFTLDRVAIGCRFDGDFFDRYWTVYFLESAKYTAVSDIGTVIKSMLRNQREEGDMGFKRPDLDALGDNKEPWRQRRILELLLFQRIVDQMHHYAAEILRDAKSHVWQNESGGAVSTAVPSRNLPSQHVRQQCQRYQQTLQIVEQDLAENLAKMETWVDRERERQNEPPRWTFNDEIRYRTIISKLSIQNDHSIRELRRTHANMSRFSEALTTELERLANEVDRRREDNIKRFTYVTVIFLPLSFGTGVFSMSEAPSSQTLESMIKTSVVAFVATLALLIFSEHLESLFRIIKEVLYRAFRRLSDTYYSRKLRGSHTELRPVDV